VEIFSQLGGVIISRWFHVLTGITWIGLLYYFNFVQTPAFAQFDAPARTEATAKLVPRALWWFRWSALATFLTGVMILGFQEQFKMTYFKSIPGTSILTGAFMATLMFANVWLVIWPNQKIVIANAQNVLAGGEADPNTPGAARRGLLASRTNTLLSIPMLWFMVATSHFVGASNHFKLNHVRDGMTVVGPGRSLLLTYWAIVIVIVAIIEANALGLLGGTGPGPTRAPLEDHKKTIIASFILWAILYGLWEILLRA
jgi:uncharacterized membrane protein